MNEKVKKVLKGFTALSDYEKREFIENLEKLTDGTYQQKEIVKKSLNESLARNSTVNFAPPGGGCPCCGR